VKTIHLALVRALIGSAFAVLGIGIAIQLLLRPEPLAQKYMGLGFSLVLIALGVVRVRGYLLMRKTQP
jgi:hypothetical protein